MKRFPCSLLALPLLAVGLAAAEPAAPAAKLPPAARQTVDFVRDVQPILAQACLSCHGAEKQRGGLRLDSGRAALQGGNSGAVLKPGDAAGSRLLALVAGLEAETRMPPEGRKPLSTDQVALLRAWIEQGAKWPETGTTATTQQTRSGHWAFQPVQDPPLPAVRARAWVRADLDAFVLARLEKEQIAPSPEADRLTLLRRLSLDLLGLPPTPELIDAWLADTGPGAYERLVDRLLASPHYGERWARHWLDQARYADSDGYEKDTPRPHAWRYRNWVIDALNADLPFDQFTLQQLAGDLLPGSTLGQKVATGFHRNTLTNKEGGVDQEQFRVEACVDRVNTTAKVFLGITLGCAQCHDHKYDPFSQREYYQFLAFFNSDTEVNLPVPLPGEEKAVAERQAAHEKKLKELQAAVEAYRAKELPGKLEAWEKGLAADARKKLPAPVQAVLAVEPGQRSAAQKQALADHFGRTDAPLTALAKAVSDHQKEAPQVTQAQTLALGKTRPTHVHLRGDFLRKGVAVEPGTPAVLPPLKAGAAANRLDLARWLVDPANPLTARVLVNWVWHKYFGRGIVPTLEDLGTQGEKPSHPELLDHLATQLVRRHWSLKELHRYLVTSATYRQASTYRPELAQKDPYNVLLARQVRLRLEAEGVRDVCLAASGLLNRTIGGPSVRPPQSIDMAQLTYAGLRWTEDRGAERYRRGLYIWFQRTAPYPMLMTFDAPDSNLCCVRRERSNTPLQALTLLNDIVFVEAAQALGRRLAEAPGGVAERVRHGFRLCLTREPTAAELSRLSRLYADLLELARANPKEAEQLAGKGGPVGLDTVEVAAWVALGRTLLNLEECVTRE